MIKMNNLKRRYRIDYPMIRDEEGNEIRKPNQPSLRQYIRNIEFIMGNEHISSKIAKILRKKLCLSA